MALGPQAHDAAEDGEFADVVGVVAGDDVDRAQDVDRVKELLQRLLFRLSFLYRASPGVRLASFYRSHKERWP